MSNPFGFSTWVIGLFILIVLAIVSIQFTKDFQVLDNHLLYIQSHCTLPTR